MARLDNQPVRIAIPPIGLPHPTPYRLVVDEANGIIRGLVEGNWTLDLAEDFLGELAELIEERRRRSPRVRVLIDRRGLPWQSGAIADRFADANATMFGAGDRLAVVVESSLAKGQMRRLFRHAGSQAFLSQAAAELWLTAWR